MQALHKWNGIRLEIAEYCRDNQIREEDFRFLGIYDWKNVYERVLERFVDHQYGRKNGLYWSNINGGFRNDIQRVYCFQEGANNHLSYEWIEKLPEIVNCEKVYLLLEEDRNKYWIAECKPSIVSLIINEAIGYTDYYITDKKFNWLITENHHDIVQFLGEGLNVEQIEKACTYTKKYT